MSRRQRSAPKANVSASVRLGLESLCEGNEASIRAMLSLGDDKDVLSGLIDCMGVNSLSAEMLMANYFSAGMLAKYCTGRLNKSDKGGAATLAERIAREWAKPSFEPLPAPAGLKRKQPAEAESSESAADAAADARASALADMKAKRAKAQEKAAAAKAAARAAAVAEQSEKAPAAPPQESQQPPAAPASAAPPAVSEESEKAPAPPQESQQQPPAPAPAVAEESEKAPQSQQPPAAAAAAAADFAMDPATYAALEAAHMRKAAEHGF